MIWHLHTLIFWLVCAATCRCTRISTTIHNKHKNLKPFKHLSIILEGPVHAFDLMRIWNLTFYDCTRRASNENWRTLARICCDLERTAMCVPQCLLGDNQSACPTVCLTAWRDCPVNCSCQHSSANWQPPIPQEPYVVKLVDYPEQLSLWESKFGAWVWALTLENCLQDIIKSKCM